MGPSRKHISSGLQEYHKKHLKMKNLDITNHSNHTQVM